MLLSLKIQFFFFNGPITFPSRLLNFSSSDFHEAAWTIREEEKLGWKLPASRKIGKGERRKERKRERGGDPDPNPRDEKTWLVDQSAEGRKEVPVRGPPTSTSVYLWYLSLSFDYSWGVVGLLRLLIFFICEPGERDIGSWEPDCIATGRHRVTMEGESRRNGRSLVILISLWKTCGFHR